MDLKIRKNEQLHISLTTLKDDYNCQECISK